MKITTVASVALLSGVSLADFLVFYGNAGQLYGRRHARDLSRRQEVETSFEFFTYPPDCDDVNNARYGLNLVPQDTDPTSGIACYANYDGAEYECNGDWGAVDINSLEFSDNADDLQEVTTCALGNIHITKNADDPTVYDITTDDGANHGSCTADKSQEVNCGGLGYFVGGKVLSCTSECSILNGN